MPRDARTCRRPPSMAAGRSSMPHGARARRSAPEHVVRRPSVLSGAAHVARGLRMSLGAYSYRSATRMSSGAGPCPSGICACRPASTYVVRHLRHIARGPRTSSVAWRVARRPHVPPGAYAYRSAPACFPRSLWTILLPPREQEPLGARLVGAGHLWTPRTPPTPPPDPRRATHRAPEPAQVVPGPGQGRGGVSRPACAVTRAAAPPPPCPGWSPRRRESAGTRRCAGGATHGRPHA
ncbi:hypothetical protein OK006_2578 [Actinobacteria bacterium OK006]|nr:hypothetical protein OK006_2578 [Actinobacteria bacterium OK006]